VGVRQDNIRDAFLSQLERYNANSQQLDLPNTVNIFNVLPNEILLLIIGFIKIVDYTVRNSSRHIRGKNQLNQLKQLNPLNQ
jgi:hypothetical protein